MAARIWPPKVYGTDWNDMVASTSIPLTDTGDNRVTYNAIDQVWEIYIGGVKVFVVDTVGNVSIKGSFYEGSL